jgi:hypothetical protein
VGAGVLLGNQRDALKKEFPEDIHQAPRRPKGAARLLMKSINLNFAEAYSPESPPPFPPPLRGRVRVGGK